MPEAILSIETKRTVRANYYILKLTTRLYDARTPEAERRDLSMRVAMLRAQLGHPDIDTLASASEEEEEGS